MGLIQIDNIDDSKALAPVPVEREAGSIMDYINKRMTGKSSKEVAKLSRLGISQTYIMQKPEIVREVAQIILAENRVPEQLAARMVEGLSAMKEGRSGMVPDHKSRLECMKFLIDFMGISNKESPSENPNGLIGEGKLIKSMENMTLEELQGLTSDSLIEPGEIISDVI